MKCDTYMYPAQGDEVMLILYVKQLLFTECLARIWPTSLLGEDHVSDVQFVLRLGGRG